MVALAKDFDNMVDDSDYIMMMILITLTKDFHYIG